MPFVLQDRPSQLEWKLWEGANGLWSNPHGELFKTLGQWLIGVHHMQQDHFAYATVTWMWIRQHDMYVVCHGVRDDYYEESDIRASVLDILPVASPVEVRFTPPHRWKVTYWSSVLHLRVQKLSTLVTIQIFLIHMGKIQDSWNLVQDYLGTSGIWGVLFPIYKKNFHPWSIAVSFLSFRFHNFDVHQKCRYRIGWVWCTVYGVLMDFVWCRVLVVIITICNSYSCCCYYYFSATATTTSAACYCKTSTTSAARLCKCHLMQPWYCLL